MEPGLPQKTDVYIICPFVPPTPSRIASLCTERRRGTGNVASSVHSEVEGDGDGRREADGDGDRTRRPRREAEGEGEEVVAGYD
jgi:hypothetical protein